MIALGADYNGPEHQDSFIRQSISALGQAAIDARGDFKFGSSPAVNVVFYVPGSLGDFDWDGLRDGRFSRKEQMVMVQVAVPQEVANSDDPRLGKGDKYI